MFRDHVLPRKISVPNPIASIGTLSSTLSPRIRTKTSLRPKKTRFTQLGRQLGSLRISLMPLVIQSYSTRRNIFTQRAVDRNTFDVRHLILNRWRINIPIVTERAARRSPIDRSSFLQLPERFHKHTSINSIITNELFRNLLKKLGDIPHLLTPIQNGGLKTILHMPRKLCTFLPCRRKPFNIHPETFT